MALGWTDGHAAELQETGPAAHPQAQGDSARTGVLQPKEWGTPGTLPHAVCRRPPLPRGPVSYA